MNDKQKLLLSNSQELFNNIRAAMNDNTRKSSLPFELRNMKYKLNPNSNKVTISGYDKNLYIEMEELLNLDDSEWQEALGKDADVASAKARLITLINVIRENREELEGRLEGGEEFYKKPKNKPKEPENTGKEKERVVYKFGVKKDLINSKIDTYQRIIEQKSPVKKSNSPKVKTQRRDIENDLLALYKELAEKEASLKEVSENKSSKDRPQKIAKIKKSINEIKARIEKNYSKNGSVLDYGYIVKELKELIEQSKFKTFVEMDSIEKQIEFYEKLLDVAETDVNALTKQKEILVEDINKLRKEETELQKKLENAESKDSKELKLKDKAGILKTLKNFRNKESKFLKQNKANYYKEMIEALDKKIAELEKEQGIQEELEKLKDDREITNAEKSATLRILENIKKEFKNSKKKINGKYSLAIADLNTEINRIRNIKAKAPVDIDKIKEELKKVQNDISSKEKETENIDSKLKLKASVPESEQELQKRSAKARIKELKELSKEKELFKITEKGEIVINYPERHLTSQEIQQMREQTINEIALRIQNANDLMVKEFYGHKETKDEFDQIMDKLYNPENRVMKKAIRYVDGEPVEYEYEGIKEYEGREKDLEKIQMSDYIMIFERVQKAKKGDLSVYENLPDGTYEKDLEYLKTNNGKYDRVATTANNLKTLGKYGEKVEYTKLQEGQYVRNAFRGIGNTFKFFRNHVTAPIYHVIGNRIVSPIYSKLHKDDNGKSRGAFENKPLHRYLARREYFASQGKGFFSSRFNALFKAKNGNQALLNAGANEIRDFYKEVGNKIILQKKEEQEIKLKLEAIKIRKKDISEQIQMLEEAIKTTSNLEDKKKYEQVLSDYKKAEEQIKCDTEKAQESERNNKQHISRDVRYDTIDLEQHDRANKDTVTKSVAVINGFARLGIRKFIGPKIKEWLLEKSEQEVDVVQTVYDEIERKEYVQATYKKETVPVYETQYDHNVTMEDLMEKNAGKEVEGFYSVYGGEKNPQMYTLSGDEKVTAVFQSVGNKGVGFADKAGLTAPTLVNKTFDSTLMDGNGILGQDVTLDKLLDLIGKGQVDEATLDGLYFSLDDKAWFDVSKLYEVASKQVQIGEEVKDVVDKAGYWKTVVDKVPREEIVKQVVENPRITKVLTALGMVGKGAYATSVVEDIYENIRETETDIKPTKPEPRDFEIVEIEVEGKKQPKYTGKRRNDLEDEER